MQHRRERIVEVVEQAFPVLVEGRFTKPFGMVFQRAPMHQQNELLLVFHAALQFMTHVTRCGSDDRRGLAESRFKSGGLPRLDIQDDSFKNHGNSYSRSRQEKRVVYASVGGGELTRKPANYPL